MMNEEVDEYLREEKAMQREYEWLLTEEVRNVLQDIQSYVKEIIGRLKSDIDSEDQKQVRVEKYVLAGKRCGHRVKCTIMLQGANITQADLAIRYHKDQLAPHLTRIYPDAPWILQQIQDCINHLLTVESLLGDELTDSIVHLSGARAVNTVRSIMGSLLKAKDSLTLRKRWTIDELIQSPSIKLFRPTLPADTVVNMYIKSSKLILSVYHLCTNHSNQPDVAARYQLEAEVSWLNDLLLVLTLCLQLSQQLKDKLLVFQHLHNEVSSTVRT